MPLNIPGILVPFHLLINPRLVIPALSVRDIRQLDFVALKTAGYRGAVVDKDNCLTLPHRDELVPELTDAWQECRRTFGEGNVLVVSNSAGTPQCDAGGIQAESISHYLQVPVLRHNTPKPGYSCIQGVRNYFASLPTPVKDDELVVIGDRIFTDIVMANRMKARDGKRGPLAIWTSGVWTKESMGMRWIEKKLSEAMVKYTDGEKQYTTQFLKPGTLEKSCEENLAPRAYFSCAGVVEGIWRRFSRKTS